MVKLVRLCLQNIVPTFPIDRPLDERHRFRPISRLEPLVVPLELLASAVGYVAEVICFSRPAGILEVRARHRSVAFDMVDPLDPMARRAGKSFLRKGEV